MGRTRKVFTVVALAIVSAGTTARVFAQAAQRSLYVGVVDRSGVPVPNLGPSDFVVREDRVAREVLSVEAAREPMQLAVLIDNSQAAESFIRDYRESLTAFVAAMTAPDGPRHQISVISLAERPTILSEYTSDRAQLQKSVGRIFSMSGSGTYLLDGIMETSRGIYKRSSPRPTILAITSEGQELSDRHYQQVLAELKESGAALHVIVVGRPVNTQHDRSVVLDQGSRESGGRYDNILTSNALTAKLKEVANELRSQYRVTYARPQTLIPPERVTVTAAKPGLVARGTVARDDRETRRP
jgi:VWFA-related protein